jgi:selenocysteine-specific elongation factor
LLALVTAGGVMPPTLKEAADALKIDAGRARKIAEVLVLRGQIDRVSPEIFYSRAVLGDVRDRLASHLAREGQITPAGFRDLIAGSRKYCIPLLDWFDRSGMTIRVGDVRKLRRM